jgi:high-affinity iron transporter
MKSCVILITIVRVHTVSNIVSTPRYGVATKALDSLQTPLQPGLDRRTEVAQAFLITLREGLEMALIVVIVLAYLKRTGYTHLFSRVWLGVGMATGISVVAGAILFSLGKGLEGRSEEIFEGSAMLLAVAVLTWMIVWMKSQARQIRGLLEVQIQEALAAGSGMALIAIPFLAVINLRSFFNVTGVLLILFAAGLLAHGIHEFQEAGFLPIFVEHVWDVNDVLNEKGDVGGFVKGIFGYNGNPSLLEVIAYPAYLAAALVFFLKPATAPIREATA